MGSFELRSKEPRYPIEYAYAMNEEIFDVILQSTGRFQSDVYMYQQNRPPETDFYLCENFWVGDLPYKVDPDLVFDACASAGLNFRAFRQYGMRYAFCRKTEVTQSDHYYEWDHDVIIGRTIFISRLIRPTTISTSLSARLYFENCKLKTIVPGLTQAPSANAWVVAKNSWRDWLSVEELVRLRSLMSKYDLNPPDRVRRSRKHIDHAFHSFYLDQRIASIVSSFESLLKISKYQATQQFVSRSVVLAAKVGHSLSDTEAEEMYNNRSAYVHGTDVDFSEFSDSLIDKYNRFEEVLRISLLRASTEANFAALFASDETIKNNFSVSA